ncbi:MAG TPA: 2-oxo-4-hydroxy-4-carboxy-5-ureidoimidazoline decarboxylase [Gemmatimonadota bacterium]|nr:2-oxo-4-hydroxy-4-carboxy-5-ureidoimidazoline decarboxylase [Gemmatimonadota bacterium]
MIEDLDAAPRAEAVERLRDCCGSERWANAVADRRPFGDLDRLLAAAEAAWAGLGPADWREAIEHHPRLGGSDLMGPRFDATRSLSEHEQAGVLDAPETTRRALADAQREYEERFGYIFLIRASGRSATEILSRLERRMANDPETELAVAAGELREIARLRLERLFGGRERHATP